MPSGWPAASWPISSNECLFLAERIEILGARAAGSPQRQKALHYLGGGETTPARLDSRMSRYIRFKALDERGHHSKTDTIMPASTALSG